MTAVTIKGANLGANQGTSTITLGTTSITPTSWTADNHGVTTVVFQIPSGASTGRFIITVSSVPVTSSVFTVQ